MEELMAKSGAANAQGDEVKADFGRVRRRSKDIEHDLNNLAEAAAEWNMLAGGGRNRRNSKDYTDEALMEAFHEIDTDKSGTIEEEELEAAIRKMDPSASGAKIRDMLDFADSDGDGKCVTAQFLPLPSRAAAPPAMLIGGPLSHMQTLALFARRVGFDEFKKIMMYKPNTASKPKPAEPAAEETPP